MTPLPFQVAIHRGKAEDSQTFSVEASHSLIRIQNHKARRFENVLQYRNVVGSSNALETLAFSLSETGILRLLRQGDGIHTDPEGSPRTCWPLQIEMFPEYPIPSI